MNIQSIKSWFISLFSYWFSSLMIFIPKNLKLFTLVSLKTSISSYQVLFRLFWWLYILAVSWDVFFHTNNYSFPYAMLSNTVWFLIMCFLGLVVFLTIRPSVDKKTYTYYFKYKSYYAYFILYTLLAWFVRDFLFRSEYCMPDNCFARWAIYGPFYIVSFITFIFHNMYHITTIYLSPFLIFLILFFLDSDGSAKSAEFSLRRAFKMVVYNYPFCVIAFVISLYSYVGIRDVLLYPMLRLFIAKPYVTILAEDFAKLFLVIPMCFMGNFYVKKVHDQFSLYFKKI